MDIEIINIIKLVFPDGVPVSWKKNSNFSQYLSKLGGYNADELKQEPSYLQDEISAVQQSTQELVFLNYKTFIETSENSQRILKQFSDTNLKLDQLRKQIPEFHEKCHSFCIKLKDINNTRKLHNITQIKNTEVLEILEMPQLMESCLRNSQYNDALEISQYIRHLRTKYYDIPIIQMVGNEIENTWWIMVNQIADTLREDLPLPTCLQLVGLLRSMEIFTECELRLKFLHTRNTWFQSLLNFITGDDPTIHLTKTVELTRIHLFNIITQYKALFNDEGQHAERQDSIYNTRLTLDSWVEEKVSEFLITLEQDLPKVTSIESILGQCTYFGMSFCRIGVDFTSRIAATFVKVINAKFERSILKVTQNFENDMETFTFINKFHPSDVNAESIIRPGNPPEQLVAFHPLAEYCNGLTSVCNELRLCIPASLCQNFTHAIYTSLYNVSEATLRFYKHERQAFTVTERNNMHKFAECLVEYLIPHVQNCIHVLFAPSLISTHFGQSISQLQKEGIIHLNITEIIKSLSILLPVQITHTNIQ